METSLNKVDPKLPFGKPGKLTEKEQFLFDTTGFLVIPNALNPEETEACIKAAERVHKPYPKNEWRQLGNTFETEVAFENLIDHPSVFPKVRALLGDNFFLQSSWCTMVPSGYQGQRFHQDGSTSYPFRKLTTPTPLIQLRIGYVLTDLSQEGRGNLVVIPGSHNSSVPLPEGLGPEEIPISLSLCAEPGTAIMFHQGVYHCGGKNKMDLNRYIVHMVYAPPWLIRSDRKSNSPEFLARISPLRRALMGEWARPEDPFGGGLEKLPFEN